MAQRKTVLITGCSEGGIGDALARDFHKKGYRVFATARNLSKVAHLDSFGIETLQLDVTDDGSIKNAVQSVTELTNGALDFLINNSGSGYSFPLLDSDTAIAQKVFAVNVFAVVAVTTAFSPLLIAAKGTLINIGSAAGKAPLPWAGYYNASKAAVNVLTDQFRIELAPFDVKVISVISGGVKTHFFQNNHAVTLPTGSLYEPAREDIEKVMSGVEIDAGNMDVELYAAQFVASVSKEKPKKHLWLGSSVWIVWLLSTFGYESIWDLALRTPPYRMGIVNKKIRAAQKQD